EQWRAEQLSCVRRATRRQAAGCHPGWRRGCADRPDERVVLQPDGQAALIVYLLAISIESSGLVVLAIFGSVIGPSGGLCRSRYIATSCLAISQSAGQIRTRRFAHLAFAAPPLFVLIGVFFYMLNVPNGDYAFWAIAWLGVLGFAAFVSATNEMPAAA